MIRYRYAVKVHRARVSAGARWRFTCQGCCGSWGWRNHHTALAHAIRHAARCEDLHWSNAATICPACQRYGLVAPACQTCLGYGHLPERTEN